MLTQNIRERGGTYARCFALARNLAALGHEVTLLAASRGSHVFPKTQFQHSVCVIEMGGCLPTRLRHGGLDPLDLLNRLQHIIRNRYDLVQTFDHRPTVLLPALLHRRLSQAPIVADWCDLWGLEGLGGQRSGLERLLLTPFDNFFETWLITQAEAVTPISDNLYQRALRLGQSQEHLQLIPAGANDDLIVPESTRIARQKLGLPPEDPILIFSGYTAFGAQLMGEAFVEVSHRRPGTRLILVGGRLPQLEAIVARAGLQSCLQYFGEVAYEQVGPLLACGDVMLLPYPDQGIDRAGFPNKLGDYMAAARPVVTNPVGDSGRLVQAEGIGLVAEETPLAFAEAICRLLADPALREQMGQRARHLAEQRFSWRLWAQAMDMFYQSLLMDKKSTAPSKTSSK